MSDVADEIATIVADWWADVIVNPKFDNGEIGFATALARYATKEVSERQLTKFKGLLGQYVVDEIAKLTTPDATFVLSCDYGPDKTLYHFAAECLISDNNFPWKTTMWVGRDFCQVRYGYSNHIEYIYVTESRLQRCLKSAEDNIIYWQNKDDEYFESWSSFSKQEILDDAQKELELAKQNLQNFKSGIEIDQLRAH